MQKNKIYLSTSGLCAMGAAALLLSGCGGSTTQKNTFGNFPNTLPAAYGIEPVAANSDLQGPAASFQETSGLASADSTTPYLTSALDFTILKAPDGATLAANVDPNKTGKVPLGFPLGGLYLASTTPVPTAVKPGASVVFRAAFANGVSDNTAAAINVNGNTLSSTDPEWTLGTLPLTFNNITSGPLANATYVTGTGGTPAPFTLPFTTSGIHTVIVTVADNAGRQTATTFAIPVVTSTDVALLLQNITPDEADGTAGSKPQPITAGDTVTIDGGSGIGSYPAMGFNAGTGSPSAPTTADAQGTVILFTTPGQHVITDTSTDAKGVVTTVTQTITIPGTAAGTTLIDVPAPGTATATVRQKPAKRH